MASCMVLKYDFHMHSSCLSFSVVESSYLFDKSMTESVNDFQLSASPAGVLGLE
jgi:hypothetical protein